MTAESRQKVILNWFILHATWNKNNHVYVKHTKLNYIYKIKKKNNHNTIYQIFRGVII